MSTTGLGSCPEPPNNAVCLGILAARVTLSHGLGVVLASRGDAKEAVHFDFLPLLATYKST
jgi:hypothetical protein